MANPLGKGLKQLDDGDLEETLVFLENHSNLGGQDIKLVGGFVAGKLKEVRQVFHRAIGSKVVPPFKQGTQNFLGRGYAFAQDGLGQLPSGGEALGLGPVDVG